MPRKGDAVLVCKHIPGPPGDHLSWRWFHVDPPGTARSASGALIGEFSWLCICTSCAALAGSVQSKADWVVLGEDVETQPVSK